MTTRRLFIGFFLIYGILIPIFAQEFLLENTSATIAMVSSCLTIALMFYSGRAFFINIIITIYVFLNYLTRPFVSIFEKGLYTKNLSYIKEINSFFNPAAAATVYWSLFSLLIAWLIGLILLRCPKDDNAFSLPNIFTRIDRVIQKGGAPFFFVFCLLFILNYKSLESGLQGTITGEGSTTFLWGLASLFTIQIVCLYVFIKRQYDKIKPSNYYLLVLPLITSLSALFAGSRSSVFFLVVTSFAYWLMLNIHKKWKLYNLLKLSGVLLVALSITIISGLFAQVLRPLYRYTEHVSIEDIITTLDYESVLLAKENLLFGITQLLHRLSALKAQFYILNDWYIYEPLQYYNPLQAFMRVINDLLPGELFPGILTINQLFDYIYHGTNIHYASEMWGIQGTLYLYFGHFGSPIVVFLLALMVNRFYPTLEKALLASSAFAAFIVLLLLDFLTNGTAERIIIVDIVRPITSFIIFLFLYKLFSSVIRSLHQDVKKSKDTVTKVIE